jgi:hypothetical protein
MPVHVRLVLEVVDILHDLQPETAAVLDMQLPINNSTHLALTLAVVNAGGKLMIQRAPLQESFAHLVPNLLLVYRPGLLPARHFENLCIALLPDSLHMDMDSFEAIARGNAKDPLSLRGLPYSKKIYRQLWCLYPPSLFEGESPVDALLARLKEEERQGNTRHFDSGNSYPTGNYRPGSHPH